MLALPLEAMQVGWCHGVIVAMQPILLEPRTGSDPPVWRGPLSGDDTEALIEMDAYTFDSLVSS